MSMMYSDPASAMPAGALLQQLLAACSRNFVRSDPNCREGRCCRARPLSAWMLGAFESQTLYHSPIQAVPSAGWAATTNEGMWQPYEGLWVFLSWNAVAVIIHFRRDSTQGPVCGCLEFLRIGRECSSLCTYNSLLERWYSDIVIW